MPKHKVVLMAAEVMSFHKFIVNDFCELRMMAALTGSRAKVVFVMTPADTAVLVLPVST